MSNRTHRFCAHGWVIPEEDQMPTARTSAVRIVEPADGVIRTDRVWPQQTAIIAPTMVISCIGGIEFWRGLGPRNRFLMHARGFSERDAALAYAQECTTDQYNFILDLFHDGPSTVTRPDPLPIPDIADKSPYLILGAYLDRWAPAGLQWCAEEADVQKEFQGLHGMTGGCMLRCAFKVDAEQVTTPVVACWLYATGPSDRMRWAIHPWPEKLPPPPVPAW